MWKPAWRWRWLVCPGTLRRNTAPNGPPLPTPLTLHGTRSHLFLKRCVPQTVTYNLIWPNIFVFVAHRSCFQKWPLWELWLTKRTVNSWDTGSSHLMPSNQVSETKKKKVLCLMLHLHNTSYFIKTELSHPGPPRLGEQVSSSFWIRGLLPCP